MATVPLITEEEATGLAAEVFADIRKSFNPPVPSLFRALAHNPSYLKASWARLKIIMGPGHLDRKTKEMIAVAVSATNGCDYCVHLDTTTLRATRQ